MSNSLKPQAASNAFQEAYYKMKPADPVVQLILMRHAKSSWADDSLNDHDRPLNVRGTTAAPVMAKWLAAHHLYPDQILTSSARRTCETAEIIANSLNFKSKSQKNKERDDKASEIKVVPELYLASPQTILRAIQANASEMAKTVLVLGHNPGMEVLVSSLSNDFTEMPTASLAVFTTPEKNWKAFLESGFSELEATIARAHFVRPRDLTAN